MLFAVTHTLCWRAWKDFGADGLEGAVVGLGVGACVGLGVGVRVDGEETENTKSSLSLYKPS